MRPLDTKSLAVATIAGIIVIGIINAISGKKFSLIMVFVAGAIIGASVQIAERFSGAS